jgi:hypothetical protein
MPTMVHEKDEAMTTAAKPAHTWQDDPAIVRLNFVLRSATTSIAKGGKGGFMEVAATDDVPPPVPGGEPFQGATVRVVVPTPVDAEWVRSQLATDFPDISVEESAGPSGDTAVYIWVPGPHGRVGWYTNQKCRDILCTAAWRQKNTEMREQRRARARANPALLDGQHGKPSTRTNYGCDCPLCKAAHADAAHQRKQRKRLAAVVDMVATMGGNTTAEIAVDDPDETVVYAGLPTVDAAETVTRYATDNWANAQRQGLQVVFIVETRLAADLELVPAPVPAVELAEAAS